MQGRGGGSTEKGWIVKKRGCSWRDEKGESIRIGVERDIVRRLCHPRGYPGRLSLSAPHILSLSPPLLLSRSRFSILLLPLRCPDALGIRVSSSPSASLCRRSFFLRLSLLVPSLFTIPAPPSPPRHGAFALSLSDTPSRRLHLSLFSCIVALPPFPLPLSLSLSP